MQFEIKITPHDLKVILIDIAGKPLGVTLKLKDTEELIEAVNILGLDLKQGLLTVCDMTNPSVMKKISYLEIECIEFESFFKYKSSAAKNFIVE